MNIFGEGFPQEIIDQVAVRQKIYGSGFVNNLRTPEEILYLNSNTAWCKLASSVNISNINIVNNPTIKKLANGVKGDYLARQFVLFNGTANLNLGADSDLYKGLGLREGITPTNSLLGDPNYAYGIGGTEYGLRPMMGIISANIQHENRGSLRTAEVKIKAFNRTQFEIIDVLYLRLGFTVLLEWGNSFYFNNKEELVKDHTNSLVDYFLDGNMQYDGFLKKIIDQRLKSNGNYDAMFATVTNFHWSFLPDGSYDITLNLISVGDIIESLKVNTNTSIFLTKSKTNSNSEEDLNEAKEDEDTGALVDYWSNKHIIGSFLYYVKNLIESKGTEYEDSETAVCTINSSNQSNTNAKYNPTISQFDPNKFEPNHVDGMKAILYKNWAFDPVRYYIRLGTFLQFLQEYVIPHCSNDNVSFIPYLKFDFDEQTNIFNLNPLQTSIDPTKCLINRTIDATTNNSDELNFVFGFGNQSGKNSIVNSVLGDKYGNIMNIYVDMKFIIDEIEKLQDDQFNLSLIDFLKAILSGLNTGLGGINDFDVFIDETTNVVKIIDKNPIKDLDEVLKKIKNYHTKEQVNLDPCFFNLYGYYQGSNSASFIKNFSFTTELSSKFSTMVATGAAANGEVIGENNTALSRLNRGLQDRFKQTLTNYPDKSLAQANTPQESVNKLQEAKNNLTKKYKETYLDYVNNFLSPLSVGNNYFKDVYLNNEPLDYKQISVTEEEYSKYQNSLSTLIQLDKEIQTLDTKINEAINPYLIVQGTGFIPFNLSLTMNGLSGMKINQQFKIDSSYLPSNYPTSVKFLIRNITHEIKDNKWDTKLESYIIANDSKIVPENTIVTESPKAEPKAESKKETSTKPETKAPPQTPETPTSNNQSQCKTKYPEFPWSPKPDTTYLYFQAAVNYMRPKYNKLTIQAVFYIMWNEARQENNTRFVSPGGHNYAGVQTDNARWSAPGIKGQYCIKDSGGEHRAFAIFDSDSSFLDFMAKMVITKNINGSTPEIFSKDYLNKWVYFDLESKDKALFNSKYKQKLANTKRAQDTFDTFLWDTSYSYTGKQ